jgi:hypothetical protein
VAFPHQFHPAQHRLLGTFRRSRPVVKSQLIVFFRNKKNIFKTIVEM